ncbi:MAG: S8/S53 family peptidase [Nitrospirae bacterium]|nr:S8/S53 family peptidase [Nitrospirota bacterium]MBF0618110.1 S8/S53 family peptidase [Nitrospirota bacterium]
MSKKSERSIVKGSERVPFHGAVATGPIHDEERFEITVRVRRKTPLKDLATDGSQYLTHDTYDGADSKNIELVKAFAEEHGLVVVETSAARRSVFLSGTAANFSKAFETKIEHHEHEGGTYRGRTGPLTVPTELADVIEGVFGIDNRPAARPHYQHSMPTHGIGITPHGSGTSFTPPELAKLYDFPTGVDGSGQCIAIIELGGGYRTTDIVTYFQKLGLPVPHVQAVSVDGATNNPTTYNSADSEVMLDIEVAAAIAPKAHIVVYFAPNTDKGFLDAITMAIHDTVNKPSVISISWGGAEKYWTIQSMLSYNQAFQTAAALGITVFCAAGDNGSGDGVTDGKAHADFPASAPYVTACGGTKLTANGSIISSEVVWNENPATSATGGGVSDFFPVPVYQNNIKIPSANNPSHYGRCVPDVAADADPFTGYFVRVDGQYFTIGGTSAVAPLWAGLIALYNQKLGKHVGFINPIIYGPAVVGKGFFRDITSGNNGAYQAKQGWDACTGWGSPDGAKLLKAF